MLLDKWYEVDSLGETISDSMTFKDSFKPVDLIVSRIPTLLLAGERYIRKYSQFLLDSYTDEIDMYNKYGYRVWNKNLKTELKRRINFLNKYIFRVEKMNTLQTTAEDHLKEISAFPTAYYRSFLTKFLIPLKKSYDLEHTDVKKMNDLDFKIWLLKNEERKVYIGK